MKELKIISLILFVSIFLFIIILSFQLIVRGPYLNPDTSYNNYYTVTMDEHFLTSLSILLVAYGFQQNLFHTYNNLQVKTNRSAIKTVSYGILISFIIYTIIALLSIYMFGSDIQENILDNIAEESSWPSYVLRSAFLLVITCHIPFMFFAGRDSLLQILEEAKNRKISIQLSKTILSRSFTKDTQP